MNESEAMRFEDALTLDAQDAKTVIERYYQLCDGDNTPSQFALWPTRSLGGGWEALPGEPEPNKAAIAQLVAELPRAVSYTHLCCCDGNPADHPRSTAN